MMIQTFLSGTQPEGDDEERRVWRSVVLALNSTAMG